jgi:hypothetical protein
MWVVGVLCIVVGLVFILGLRSVGRSRRAAGAWTTYNKSQVLVAGVVAIVLGVVLLLAGGDITFRP